MEGGVVIGGNTRGNAREVLKVLATCAANDVLLSICRVLSETEINDIHVAILSVYMIFKMSFLNIIFKKNMSFYSDIKRQNQHSNIERH